MTDRERQRRLDLLAMQFVDALEAGDAARDPRQVHGERPDPLGRRVNDQLLLDDHDIALLGPRSYTAVP